MLTALQKYANDDARKRGSVPKYQVYNNALLTAYKGRGFMTDRTDTRAWGRWVESAVGAHLLSMADELDYEVALSFLYTNMYGAKIYKDPLGRFTFKSTKNRTPFQETPMVNY